MANIETKNIVLTGNPNIGKSSLFNCLTGMRQKVGNFAGVTVEKKTGTAILGQNQQVNVLDLPGTYSLYPRQTDEWVSYNALVSKEAYDNIDAIIVLVDASNLKRNLLFCSQIIDLKKPVVVALTMIDIAKQKGIKINIGELERELGVPVIPINPRTNKGIPELKKALDHILQLQLNVKGTPYFIPLQQLVPNLNNIDFPIATQSQYLDVHYIINYDDLDSFNADQKRAFENIEKNNNFNATRFQAQEILMRYQRITALLKNCVTQTTLLQKKQFSNKLDDILLHRRYGYIILFVVLFLLFQSIFWLAQFPMDFMETTFNSFKSWVSALLPNTWWSALITDGLLAGIGGILVFVPQIMILFGLLTILEDTGYMSRMSFLSDRFMRRIGLNGKSVMPLVGGFACAVPSIMAARSIDNKKERLLTILVAPLISCSARLPVYTVLIGLVIPQKTYFGLFNLQGLVMAAMYLFGVLVAFLIAFILKIFIKVKDKSIFILELPVYRAPNWKNILITMWQRGKSFVQDAGKVIIVISIVLFALSYFGPSKKMNALKVNYANELALPNADTATLDLQYAQNKLANSYAGIMGKAIEPSIRPLGYDWKIGVSLICSFAAREVFVGTMATLYSVNNDETSNQKLLKEKMADARFEDGSKVYTLATGVSLLIFYAIALQCMSTFAVVKRELKSTKWALAQLIGFTAFAYLFSFIAYQLLK
jgi:ferrous iron transport protein B